MRGECATHFDNGNLAMVKSGLQDWLVQRITAVFMVIYSVGLFSFLIAHPNMAYYEWHGLFVNLWVKVATLLFVLSLLAHAWVGMWTVFTDYVKPLVFRLILSVLVLLSLVAFFFQTLLILWGV